MDTMTRASTPDQPAGAPEALTVDRYARWALAALSLAAAAVHFAFAPVHFGEEWAHGAFFLVLAWLQLMFAVAILTRPGRALLAAGAAVNLAAIAVWALSRTVGVPFGAGAGEAEAAAFPDIFATVAEVGIVAIAVVWLARPALASRPVRSLQLASGITTAVAVGALFSASLALTPAVAGEHHVGDGGDETAAGGDGHDHGGSTADAADATDADGHAGHGAVGEQAAAFNGDSPCELSGPPASPGQANKDAEGHDHRGPSVQEPLDQEQRVVLAGQMEAARTVADKYPTVAEAEKAGYGKSTAFVPCIGAHYTNVGLVGKFDPAAPSELLFDGTTPDAKLVGLSYLNYSKGGPPDGFAGDNDQWHQHNDNGGLCFKGAVVIGGESTSEERCTEIGGAKRPLTDIWMVHAWIVPGWECSWGVFAGECPELGGKTGGTAWDAPDPEFEASLKDE